MDPQIDPQLLSESPPPPFSDVQEHTDIDVIGGHEDTNHGTIPIGLEEFSLKQEVEPEHGVEPVALDNPLGILEVTPTKGDGEHPNFAASVDQPSTEWRSVWYHTTQSGHFWHSESGQTSLLNPTMPSGATWKVLYDLGERAWYFWNSTNGVSQWRNPHLTDGFHAIIGREEQAMLLKTAWPSENTLREHQHDSLGWRPMWDVVQQAWYFHNCAYRKTQWANPSIDAQVVWHPMWYCDGGRETWFFYAPLRKTSQWENPYFQPPEVLAAKVEGKGKRKNDKATVLEAPEDSKKRKTESPDSDDAAKLEIAALSDKKWQAIYEDSIKCSNVLRSKVQGPGFCNEALLSFPGQSCRFGPEERNECELGGDHPVWPTSGELKTDAGCEIKCQLCGFRASGKGRKAAGYLRMHAKTHTGETFVPNVLPKDRQLWTMVMQGSNPPLRRRGDKEQDEAENTAL